MARRDEGGYPQWISDRGATKPDGLSRENPPGGGAFAFGLRWFVPYSPLRGCAEQSASPKNQNPQPQHPSQFSDRLYGKISRETSIDCLAKVLFK